MSTETTRRYTPPPPGIQAAAVALHDMDHYCDGVEGCAAEFLPHARKALGAALDVEEMAAKLWELEYRRDVGGPPGFPWRAVREPIKKIYRDQARDLRAALLGEEVKSDA